MKIKSKNFRVRPGARVKLKEWPTKVKPFCKSKKHCKKLMEEQPDVEAGSTERPGEVAVRVVQTELSDAVRRVLHAMTLLQLSEHVNQQSRATQMYYI